MEVIKFVVDERPFACWDWKLLEKNIEFLEGIDANYFRYIAETHNEHVEGDSKHRAALALRLAYSHGLETLFALLCSVIQAPQCVVGWMLTYRNVDLVNLVRKISREEAVYTVFKKKPVTWKSLAVYIHNGIGHEQEKKLWIQEGFGKLWSWFADDFLSEDFNREYNGIKHGLRVRPGGFSLAMGFEDIPGVPASPDKMMTIASSEFGSSYFVGEVIAPLNFRPRRHCRNWNLHHLVNGLIFTSMSINNVVSWLRTYNGVTPAKCQYINPSSKDLFEDLWKEGGGEHLSFDLTIEKTHIYEFSKKDIVESYDGK
jgi:hypothetical protein